MLQYIFFNTWPLNCEFDGKLDDSQLWIPLSKKNDIITICCSLSELKNRDNNIIRTAGGSSQVKSLNSLSSWLISNWGQFNTMFNIASVAHAFSTTFGKNATKKFTVNSKISILYKYKKNEMNKSEKITRWDENIRSQKVRNENTRNERWTLLPGWQSIHSLVIHR